MSSKPEILKILVMLSAAYPNFNLTEETIGVYARLLVDLDSKLLEAAALRCASLIKFFPSVAEIREAAIDLLNRADSLPSAIEAWGEVQSQMMAVGHNGNPNWSHPLVGKIVKLFGWRVLCLSETITADRAHFLDAYDEARKRLRAERQILPEVYRLVGAGLKQITDKDR